jgi:hypothetical protein
VVLLVRASVSFTLNDTKPSEASSAGGTAVAGASLSIAALLLLSFDDCELQAKSNNAPNKVSVAMHFIWVRFLKYYCFQK